ncbi:MAG: UDP-N-acetylglucosamine 2-epimerase (hydrolyzing) [Phycisphaerales bacterium]|nr:UDP-N-acetylglucosamine 2-epimerase (hydrolyzing) [Phycisphaerales bacterium]MCB9864881.1 UDP-N-acetylglucosamine 2-epimerase (hydrolyzing) [Phycisphaerales bacterium]
MSIAPIHLNGVPLTAIRRVACISTSRADSGIYRSLWHALIAGGYETTCLAGGTHLSSRAGATINELRAIDGLRVVPVAHATGDGTAAGVASAAGEAMGAFARAIDAVRPELVFVLGDRLEMLAAAMSATAARVPIAHLHGGERTAGAYDDQCRDAMSMLSALHFAAMPAYASRIRSMGVDASRVFCVGALAIDAIQAHAPMSVVATSRAVGLDLSRPTLLVLFHPETLGPLSADVQGRIVADALREVDKQVLVVGVNADVGSVAVGAALASVAELRDSAVHVASVPPEVFYSCMAHAWAMVGNSSSGMIEAASFDLPVVNIGNRQGGRIRPANVVDVAFEPAAIGEAIRRVTTPSFRAGLHGISNPYGDGLASARICSILRGEPIAMFE